MRWHPLRYILAALLGVLFLFLPVSIKFPAVELGKEGEALSTPAPPEYVAVDVASAAPCPGGSVTVTAGSSSATVQSLITANAAGTNFCFQNGTYNLSDITPKVGNGFYAQNMHLAILDGNNTAQSAFISTFGFGSSSNVDNVTLDGFVVRNYRNSNPYGTKISAIDANNGWKLRNLIVENNSGGVAFAKTNWDCAYDVEIRDSIFRNNTHYALYFNGRDAEITDNTFYNNGYGGSVTDRMWEGSIKITNQGINGQSSICPNAPGAFINILGNLSYGNAAAGWWQDINVEDFLFQDNDILYNERWGFFQEIADGTSTSGTQRVVGNRFECNRTGWNGGGAWGGAEINNISSSNVEISSNLVRVCPAGRTSNIGGQNYTTNNNGRGIILLSEGRRVLNNNTVVSNIVCMLGTTENLAELQQYAGSNSGNSFQDNDYYVTSLGQSKYQRFGSVTNFSGWNSFGFDTTGSETTAACPSGIVIAPTPTPSPTITPGGPTFTPTPSPSPTITPNATSGCFYGAPQIITNKIEAEDFNLGANNVAYYDTTPGMEGGVVYRNTDVDLKPNPTYGGYAVGWFVDGEYLNYCVNVPSTGIYDLVFFGGSIFAGRVAHIKIDGVDVTGDIAIPQTLDWNTYASVTVQDIPLTAGNRTMTIVNELGFLDVDWVQFFVDGESPTITPTPGISNGLCPPGTTLGSNLVVNSNFATGAGAGPGFAPAAGFTASVPNAGDNVFPDDTEVSVNTLPFSYFSGAFQEVAFAGDSPNGVPSAGAGLLHSGNNSGGSPYTIWQQTISGLSPSTTYIFWVYVNNAENEFRTDPAVFPTYGLWAYAVQLGVTVNVPRQPNNWIRIERSYTTGGSQTVVDLLIRDHTPNGTVNNDDGVITQPGFARCQTVPTVTPTYTASPTGSPTPTRTPTPSITPGGPTLTPIVITNTPGGVPSCTRCTILQTQTPIPTSTP
jgi:hypothetical protein